MNGERTTIHTIEFGIGRGGSRTISSRKLPARMEGNMFTSTSLNVVCGIDGRVLADWGPCYGSSQGFASRIKGVGNGGFAFGTRQAVPATRFEFLRQV